MIYQLNEKQGTATRNLNGDKKMTNNQHAIRISTPVYNFLNDNFWSFTKSTVRKVKIAAQDDFFTDVVYSTKKERDEQMNDIATKIAVSGKELEGNYLHIDTITY